ncbi:response regulator [bacterium]|nr:response regulator [bacterium]
MTSLDRQRVLVIDDDPNVSEVVATYLEREGCQVEVRSDGEAGLQTALDDPPDLVVLDLMLPGLDGLEVCRGLRAARVEPVVMLTAKGDETDRIIGLEVGADDYVGKPFSVRELLARIRAVLRRTAKVGDDEPIEVDGLRLDPVSHRVTANGQPVRMGPIEFRMLHFFMSHEDRVFTRNQMLDRVWGNNVYVEERTVDVHIRRLRKALAAAGFDRFVQTVHGTGYRFSREP